MKFIEIMRNYIEDAWVNISINVEMFFEKPKIHKHLNKIKSIISLSMTLVITYVLLKVVLAPLAFVGLSAPGLTSALSLLGGPWGMLGGLTLIAFFGIAVLWLSKKIVNALFGLFRVSKKSA